MSKVKMEEGKWFRGNSYPCHCCKKEVDEGILMEVEVEVGGPHPGCEEFCPPDVVVEVDLVCLSCVGKDPDSPCVVHGFLYP